MRGIIRKILAKKSNLAIFVVVLTAVFLFVYNTLPLFNGQSHAGYSFQSNYDSSLDAYDALGDRTGYTDTQLPATAAGYNGTNSLQYAYDGTSTLKYKTASNLSADKGSVEMKIQKSAYGNNSNQDVGSFNGPMGVAYDSSNGYIYVADRFNNRIVKTKIDGTVWQTFGTLGAGVGQFNSPRGISLNTVTGDLYVADACNGRIVKTKMDGSVWDTLSGFSTGSCNTTDWANEGATMNVFYDQANDDLYVAGISGYTKTKMNGTGRTNYTSWGGHTTGNTIGNVYYDNASQYIFMTDTRNAKVFRTKVDGTDWAQLTTGVGSPEGVFYDSANSDVYVACHGNGLILKSKMDGTSQSTLTGFSGPAAFVFDTANSIFVVVDQHNNYVTKTAFDGTGRTNYGSYYKNLGGITRYSKFYDNNTGFMYIMDGTHNRVIKTMADGSGWQQIGSSGSGDYQFNDPIDIYYDAATGYVYVSDRANYRIAKFKMDGTGWSTYPTGSGKQPYSFNKDNQSDYLYFSFGNESCGPLGKLKKDFSSYSLLGSGRCYFGPSYYDSVTNYLYIPYNGVTRMRPDGTGAESFTLAGKTIGSVWYDSGSGYLYLTDSTNNQVVKTDWGGTDVTTYGTTGSGQGNFNGIGNIQFDSTSGNFVVSDSGNGRMVESNMGGTVWRLVYSNTAYMAKEKVLFSAQTTDDMRIVYDVATRKIRFYLAYSNKAQFAETPTLNLTDGQWYTIKCSYNRANHTLKIDLDGVEQVLQTYDADWGALSFGTYFYIGARNGSTTDRWDGMIDDVNIDSSPIDSTKPTNPTGAHLYSDSNKTTEFTDSGWGNDADPYITFTGATDEEGGSGIRGYFIYFGVSDSADPVSASGVLETGGAFHYQAHVGAEGAEQHVQVPASALTSGVTYYLLIKAEDNDLNIQTPAIKLFTYSYDGGPPPAPEYLNVSPVGCSTTQDFTITWDAPGDSGGAGLAGYEYKNGSQGQVQFVADTTLALHPYQEGDNVIYIRSKDNAGNVSAYQTGVYCSTGVVNIIDGPSVIAGPSSITVAWVSNKATTSSVKVFQGNTYISEQGQTSYDVSHSVKVIGLKPEQTYRYQLTWADTNGNISTSDWYETQTATTPAIKDLNINVLTPTTAIATWATTYPAQCELQYGINDYTSSLALDGTNSEFSKDLSNLAGGSNYVVRVTATAADGTEFVGERSFQTPPVPIISNLRFEPVNDQAYAGMKITWTTNVETTSSVLYGPAGGVQREVATSDMKKDHEINVANLSDDTSYTLTASGTDQYGNKATSDVNTFKTALDSRPPKVSDLTIESKTGSSSDGGKAQVVVSWRTDEVSTSQVEYGEGVSSSNYSSKTQEDTTLSNAHVVVISNLDPTKTYHLRAVSKDRAGNPGMSEDNAVITQKAQQSALNLIIEAFQRAFSWIKIFSK